MLTVKQALDQGTKLLDEGSVGAPRLTAEVLLCHALRREKSFLYAHGDEELPELAWIHYGRYLHERLKGKPTQYITRVQEFYGRPFFVSPAVLIPRPETEHAVEVALERARLARRAIDIGCGSGAIGVTWSLETDCATVASDISVDALDVARRNARDLGARADFVCCDLGAALAPRSFDLVLSNPPYIPDPEGPHLQREVRDHEPPVALFGGPTGVEIYERLVRDAARILRPAGWLVMEIGYQAQERVLALLEGEWRDHRVTQDLAGWPRVISAQYWP
ncbi:MAG: peptide chain release factor N(5)-glutamine methyltransferase [Bryobacteraceae bacterium]